MPIFHFNFKIMSMWLFLTISITGFLSGCASTSEVYPPLERARAAYSTAAANPDVKANAPVALYEADKALKRAETAIDLDEKRHLSYLAEKKAAIALALADKKKAENEIALLKQEKENVILESRRMETEKARIAAEMSAREAQAAREEALGLKVAAEQLKADADAKAREAEAARQETLGLKVEAEQLKADADTKAREAQEALAKAAQLERELTALKAVKTDRGMVLTLGDVLFATGKAELAPGAMQTIDNLAAFLNKYPDRKVQIEGHTDSTGSAKFNLDLSESRAKSVKIALLGKGIGLNRIGTTGFGEEKPIVSNDTEAGRQQNRRVEIVILDPSETAEPAE